MGDNVGDVAGMGADLYESYVGSIVATMALGAIASLGVPGLTALQAIQVPVTIATIGVISSILGTFLVRSKEKAAQSVLLAALRRGTYSSTILIAVLSFLYVFFTIGKSFLGVWGSLIVGLVAGNIIGYFTEYYTSDSYKPTRSVADQTLTGPATLIIGGLSLGMLSTLIPVAVVVIATLASFAMSGGFIDADLGLYGIGLSAVGMLSTLGITLATDAYGPVADNAGGIAEMAKMDPHVRERTDALDSLGNTTAATGKGFAIASAALTALSLIAEYGNKIKEGVGQLFTTAAQSQVFERFYAGLITVTRDASQAVTNVQLHVNMLDPRILIGIFLGAVLPFVFCALAMQAVGKAAGRMVQEVRRQFKEKPGILKGTDKPDYATCVAISTQGAQKAMILPSLMAIIAPVGVGIVFGPFTVIALLASSMATGFVLAVMMANSGGIWDNAKKYIERGAHGGKGSPAHKAAVVGDTVGDPFKDTAGPALNILLKLMSMVAIVFVTVCLSLNNLLVRGLHLSPGCSPRPAGRGSPPLPRGPVRPAGEGGAACCAGRPRGRPAPGFRRQRDGPRPRRPGPPGPPPPRGAPGAQPGCGTRQAKGSPRRRGNRPAGRSGPARPRRSPPPAASCPRRAWKARSRRHSSSSGLQGSRRKSSQPARNAPRRRPGGP